MQNSSLYAIFQNKIFLSFNEWLDSLGLDFRYLSETDTNCYIRVYTDFIQSQLIDIMDQYRKTN